MQASRAPVFLIPTIAENTTGTRGEQSPQSDVCSPTFVPEMLLVVFPKSFERIEFLRLCYDKVLSWC